MSTPAAVHEPAGAAVARARSLTKAYGSGETTVLALDAVDVDIARGRFTAVMGPSGSGKSTLMHCLAGLDTVSAGQVWEIGLLRAIGLGRRQLRRMIRLESVVIAVFGAVLGLGLGLVWGLATQQVLALEGMTELALPWGTIVAVVVGSVVIGLAAALLPALRASRMNVLAAIAHE